MRSKGQTFAQAQSQINSQVLRYNRHFAKQFVVDCAVIAANETFGAGAKRAPEYLDTLYRVMDELADLTLSDAKDDKEVLYMKAKLDERLKPLLGENFVPYDERYRYP